MPTEEILRWMTLANPSTTFLPGYKKWKSQTTFCPTDTCKRNCLYDLFWWIEEYQLLVPLDVFITTLLEWQIWANTEISGQNSVTHIVGIQQKISQIHSWTQDHLGIQPKESIKIQGIDLSGFSYLIYARVRRVSKIFHTIPYQIILISLMRIHI